MHCENADGRTAPEDVIEFWTAQACNDKTEKRWVAQKMVARSSSFLKLASALQAAAKDSQNCPGVAELSDEWQQRLSKATAR